MSEAFEDMPSPEEQARRLAWFEEYVACRGRQPTDLPLRCPCCGCLTLTERAEEDICPVCFWQDDGQDDYDANVVRGGPNRSLSLSLCTPLKGLPRPL